MKEDEKLEQFIKDIRQKIAVKGEDYTIGTGDRLFNFRQVGTMNGLTMAQNWSSLFLKGVFAICNYVKTRGKSESEPIRERFLDLAVYAYLGFLISEEEKIPERERNMTETPIMIKINGEEYVTHAFTLSYYEVVDLMNGDARALYSMTYHKANGPRPDGTLIPGEYVTIKNGTYFNAFVTGNS